jgi:uncharacterized membrane protein
MLLAAIVAAPLAASIARPEAWFLYEGFGPFCHQQADRCWSIQGFPLAVCARCSGVYLGLLLAALGGVHLRVRTLAVALVLVGVSWAVESAEIANISGAARTCTGLALGFVAGAVVLGATGPIEELRPPLACTRGSDQEPVLE